MKMDLQLPHRNVAKGAFTEWEAREVVPLAITLAKQETFGIAHLRNVLITKRGQDLKKQI